jgi:transposase
VNSPVRIGMDTSTSVFQLHGVDENEIVVIRRQFRRAEMVRYFERLPSALVAISCSPCEARPTRQSSRAAPSRKAQPVSASSAKSHTPTEAAA